MGTQLKGLTDGVAPKDGVAVDQLIGGGGVLSVSGGTGIIVTGTLANPVVNNVGVLSVAAGPGISVTGTAASPTVNNTGVLSVSAGTGILIAGTAANPFVVNGGLLDATVGADGMLTTSGSQIPHFEYVGPVQTFVFAMTSAFTLLGDPVWLMPAAGDSNGTFHVGQLYIGGGPAGANSVHQTVGLTVFAMSAVGGTATFTFQPQLDEVAIGTPLTVLSTAAVPRSQSISASMTLVHGVSRVGVALSMAGAASATILCVVNIVARMGP